MALTAGFSWINGRYFRLPPSIGILVMGLAASTVLVLLELVLPTVALYEQLADLVRKVDFQTTVMNGMLAFLLFVGSIHVDFTALRSRSGPYAGATGEARSEAGRSKRLSCFRTGDRSRANGDFLKSGRRGKAG